jgi:hypothetical protein
MTVTVAKRVFAASLSDSASNSGYSPRPLDVRMRGKDGQFKRHCSPIRIHGFERNDEMCHPRCYVEFVDNCFTPYDLAELRTLGFRVTGAVREVRRKKYALEEMKESDKHERGTYDYKCDEKCWL